MFNRRPRYIKGVSKPPLPEAGPPPVEPVKAQEPVKPPANFSSGPFDPLYSRPVPLAGFGQRMLRPGRIDRAATLSNFNDQISRMNPALVDAAKSMREANQALSRLIEKEIPVALDPARPDETTMVVSVSSPETIKQKVVQDFFGTVFGKRKNK